MVHLALWKKKVALRIIAAFLHCWRYKAKMPPANRQLRKQLRAIVEKRLSATVVVLFGKGTAPWLTLVFDLRRRALYWNHSARVMLDFVICSCTTIGLGCLMGMTTLETTSKNNLHLLRNWKIGIGKWQREGGRHKARILLMEEILHKLIGSLSHYLQSFTYARWSRISSIHRINHPSISECYTTTWAPTSHKWSYNEAPTWRYQGQFRL